ncbi:probable proline--tRNA ligase, mitochondrial [Manduca sexta]|uniref:proline--tRNA ligase n=1 Tax=Manduca sexta TaxID=7130 RepID=A0A921ZNS8_MANSE|nr:probable proline--tRNA ligase, mitochondrial [Manduca sexta]KAG6461502.1 hypothetical protein O3G_MSEX012675 [Manduca sexta]
MKRLSQIFQPIITIPKNAKIKNTDITSKSQKLLLECGLVRPTSSGLFTLLPLARRSVDKLENLIKNCIETTGAQRISLPALTPANLWEKTGRIADIGPELVTLKDRHDKQYLLAPTHEETIADLLADVGPLSYKQLPLIVYQISNKYRDEHRPKHGLLRAREFLMLDAYGAHTSLDCAHTTYQRMTAAYQRLFDQLHLPVYQVRAPSGDMGGSVSHEWQLPAASGEDQIHVCVSCSQASLASESQKSCQACGANTKVLSSIEVGHTFILGTKYSDPLGAHYVPSSGPSEPVIMSCYGIGVTRLLASSLEALSTDKALRWPRAIAPYSLIIIGPKEGSKEWSALGENHVHQLHEAICRLPGLDNDVLVDDRHQMTIGKRLMMADRLGYPTIVVCGKAALDSPPRYEVYQTNTEVDATVRMATLDELLDLLSNGHDKDIAANKQ